MGAALSQQWPGPRTTLPLAARGPAHSPENRPTTRRGELQRCHSTHAGRQAASWRETREVSELAGTQAGDELFGLPPETFVAARDDLARRLRREGDAEAARRGKGAPRPPPAARSGQQPPLGSAT